MLPPHNKEGAFLFPFLPLLPPEALPAKEIFVCARVHLQEDIGKSVHPSVSQSRSMHDASEDNTEGL